MNPKVDEVLTRMIEAKAKRREEADQADARRRAAGDPTRTRAPEPPVAEVVCLFAKRHEIPIAEAASRVFKAEPRLYERYRRELTVAGERVGARPLA